MYSPHTLVSWNVLILGSRWRWKEAGNLGAHITPAHFLWCCVCCVCVSHMSTHPFIISCCVNLFVFLQQRCFWGDMIVSVHPSDDDRGTSFCYLCCYWLLWLSKRIKPFTIRLVFVVDWQERREVWKSLAKDTKKFFITLEAERVTHQAKGRWFVPWLLQPGNPKFHHCYVRECEQVVYEYEFMNWTCSVKRFIRQNSTLWMLSIYHNHPRDVAFRPWGHEKASNLQLSKLIHHVTLSNTAKSSVPL